MPKKAIYCFTVEQPLDHLKVICNDTLNVQPWRMYFNFYLEKYCIFIDRIIENYFYVTKI